MPNKLFGIADPYYDALRVQSNQAVWPDAGGSGSGIGGLLENKIYLWLADGSTIDIFDPTEAGLIAALAGAAGGDTVWLPSMTIALTAGITVPAGVTLRGISQNAVLSSSGFSGIGVTLGDGSRLEFFTIFQDGTGQALATAISAQNVSSATLITCCWISASNATSNYGVRLKGISTMNGPQIEWSHVAAIAGTNAIAIELDDYSFATYTRSGARAASTVNDSIQFIGTASGLDAAQATHCWADAGNTAALGGHVLAGKTGRATHCYFISDATYGVTVEAGGTLSVYADEWTALNNAGTIIHLPGDLSSGGSGGHIIQDEGTPLTQRANLNFVGATVTATDDAGNDATVVTISAGGSVDADRIWFGA